MSIGYVAYIVFSALLIFLGAIAYAVLDIFCAHRSWFFTIGYAIGVIVGLLLGRG